MVILVSIAALVMNASAADSVEQIECDRGREVVTLLKYLDRNPTTIPDLPQRLEVAKQVAKGCDGAAQRYITMIELGQKSEMSPALMRKTALQAAQTSSPAFEVFRKSFIWVYREDGLNLSALQAVELLSPLMDISKADDLQRAEWLEDEALDTLKVCEKSKTLRDLPLSDCLKFTVQVLQSASIQQQNISKQVRQFLDEFHSQALLSKSSMKEPDVPQKLNLLVQILQQKYPRSTFDFILTYRYLTSDAGPKLSHTDAVSAALKTFQ